MAEKALVTGVLAALAALALAAACGGSSESSGAAPDASTTAPPDDGAASGDGAGQVVPGLALPAEPSAPDCNAQPSYPEVAKWAADFDARRSSGTTQERVELIYQVGDLLPLADLDRWLRDVAACEADPKVRGAALSNLASRGHFVPKAHLRLGIGEPGEMWPADLATARSQVAGAGAPAGWAAHHLAIFGDASDHPALERLTADDNVFARFAAGVALVTTGAVARGGVVLDAIARLPNAPGHHFYIERSLLVLRSLGDKNALADLVAFLDQIDESAEPNDETHMEKILDILEVIAGEARPNAAAWREWLVSTGQPSIGTRR